MAEPFTPSAEGIVLAVRLTPRGGRDAIDGIETLSDGKTVLKARVRAAPENGEANAALIRLLAKTCHCPASAIRIISGTTSRLKMVLIAGDPALFVPQLAKMFSP
jgi:uncharacterized protein